MKKDAGSSSKGLSLTDFAKGKQHDAAVVRKSTLFAVASGGLVVGPDLGLVGAEH